MAQNIEVDMVVVPDRYLSMPILLGNDILSLQVLTVNYPKRVVQWGDITYPLRLVDNKCSQKAIHCTEESKEKKEQSCFLRLHKKILLYPGESRMIEVVVHEPKATLIVITPWNMVVQQIGQLCSMVSKEGTVILPIYNHTKKIQKLAPGILMATYETVEENALDEYSSEEAQCRLTQVINDIIPQIEDSLKGSTRREASDITSSD